MKLRYTNILLFILVSFVKQEDCASLSQVPRQGRRHVFESGGYILRACERSEQKHFWYPLATFWHLGVQLETVNEKTITRNIVLKKPVFIIHKQLF